MPSPGLDRVRASALAMVSDGRPLAETLAYLAREGEALAPGDAVCSILILDRNGLLRNGASPGLPADYLAAIDGLKPDPTIGTCAAAAATGKVVFTPDLTSDHGWRELKHLPLALGLRGAWSVPIMNDEGRILGTFGTYFRAPRRPRADEQSWVKALADVASAAIQSNPKL